jgi:hypothetical protein
MLIATSLSHLLFSTGILGYAWFSFEQDWAAGTTSAMYNTNSDGSMTALGKYYASVTPENIFGDQSIKF